MLGKKILDFYVNSSIHVALSVVSLSLITGLSLGFKVEENLLIFIFFGSITGYNFVKYAGVAKLHHRSLTRSLKLVQIFSLFCFMGFLISLYRVEPKTFLWIAFFGSFTLLYALPLFSKKRNLRSIPGIKVFIIAFVWSGVSVILPVAGKHEIFDWNVLWEFIQRILFVLVLILPFEIRDLKYDVLRLGTIPQKLGVKRTKVLGWLLLGLVLLIEFLQKPVTDQAFLSLLIISIMCGALISKAKENQPSYYSSLWVEGIPIYWLLLLLIFRAL